MRAITLNVGPLATLSATSVAASQSVASAGAALTLTSSPVIFATPANVTITSVGNDSGVTFMFTGVLKATGAVITEDLPGTNAGTATGQYIFSQINSVTANRPTASTVTAGNGTGNAQMVRLDEAGATAVVGVQCEITGSPNYSVQGSFDDPNDLVNPVPPASMVWDGTAFPVALTGASTNQSAALSAAPLWLRLLLNSQTGPSSVKMVVTQYQQVPG